MQLIDTKISSQVGGKLTIEFVGEGGESIKVSMNSDEKGVDAAILKAKEMLVQVATFGTERNEPSKYDGSWQEADAVEGLEETVRAKEVPLSSSGTRIV